MVKLIRSFVVAFEGLQLAWQSERNFRIECAIGLLAVLLGLWLRVNLIPILLCCALVLSLELMNTAIEALVDLVQPDDHPLAKRAKDVAAAAVLLAALLAAVVGFWILALPLWRALF